MQYTSHYQSPLGSILLAADQTGLTGLWFEGQKYFALHLDRENEEREIPVLKKQSSGLIFISPEKNRTSLFLCISQEQTFNRKYGIFSALFPTDRLRLTVRLPGSSPPKEVSPICLPRQWAAQSDTIRSPLLSPVTGLSAQMAA